MKLSMHRRMAMVMTICAVGLSVTACTAGITTAGPARSPSPSTGRAASSPAVVASHTASPTPSPYPTVSLNVPIGGFPSPPGAQLLGTTGCGKGIIIELGSVTPAEASSFYSSVLPRAGYKITNTSTLSGGDGLPGPMAEIEFTGHGYKGFVDAIGDLGPLGSASPSQPAQPTAFDKNFLSIVLNPVGAPGCPVPTGT